MNEWEALFIIFCVVVVIKCFSIELQVRINDLSDIEDSIMDDEELKDTWNSFHHQVTKYEEDFMEELQEVCIIRTTIR